MQNSESNLRLIEYLQRKISRAPRPYLERLVRRARIRRNDLPSDPGQRLESGDVITLPESRRLTELLALSGRQPEILHETPELIVVHKPAGLATHASKGHEHDNLTDRVRELMRYRDLAFAIAPVHRLDRPTSGPVLFGKGRKSIAALGRMMQSGDVRKIYLALVPSGLPESGRLTGQIPSKGTLKQASTRFWVVRLSGDLALLELSLETGRQHQIRRQLAAAGYPVFGDRRYAAGSLPGLDRLFLHCRRLQFVDPFSSRLLTIDDPLPSPLENLLARNGFGLPNPAPRRPDAIFRSYLDNSPTTA